VTALVRLLLMIALVAVARDASAFVTNCSKHFNTNGFPHGLWRRSSQAPNGSLRHAAIANALAQWARVIPTNRGIHEVGTFTGSHNISEAPSEISFMTEGTPGFFPEGLGGVTFVRQFGCMIQGVDILLSANLSYAQPGDSLPTGDPLFFPDPGWSVAVHELGHAIGLALPNNHPNTFAVMRATGPMATFGAFPFAAVAAALAPDDVAGARFLYGARVGPGGVPERNVTSTQTRLFPGGIGKVWNPPNAVDGVVVNVCRGENLIIPSHTGNIGVFSTMNHMLYIQPFGVGNPWNASDPNNRFIAGQVGAQHSPDNTNLINHSAHIPCNTPVGMYHVMHFADSGFQVPEYQEFDNTSMYFVSIAVQGCSTTACIFG
jgi:hypothetical protein